MFCQVTNFSGLFLPDLIPDGLGASFFVPEIYDS
jgi:hypothetical protein